MFEAKDVVLDTVNNENANQETQKKRAEIAVFFKELKS
jgi:hypothetical protein